MTENRFDPDRALGRKIAEMDRQELCGFVARLCRALSEELGETGFHGGIYPENISLDDEGVPAVGPGRVSDWEGRERDFVAPELYWDGKTGQTCDVYSVGLLLYYGLCGALPFEGESPDPQLSRMSGKAFPIPAAAGPALGDIIAKAASFRPEDRFRTLDELRVRLESCGDHRYIRDDPVEELFRKPRSELNEAEKLLLAILTGEPQFDEETPAEETPVSDTPGEIPAEDVPADDVPAGETPAEEMSREEVEEAILAEHVPPRREAPEEDAEVRALVDSLFAEPVRRETPEEAPAGETAAPGAVPPAEEEEPDDVRVYEPGQSRKMRTETGEKRVPIPILTVEDNPELVPVKPKRTERTLPGYDPPPDPERKKKVRQKVIDRRRGFFGVTLILLALLIVAALVVNNFFRNFRYEDEGLGREVVIPKTPEEAITTGTGFVTADELQAREIEAARQSYYQVFPGDISWTDAKNACTEKGGMLAVINTHDEFTMVSRLAEQSGVRGVWVGCHRENTFLVWEREETIGTMSWADGNPSYYDTRDGAAKDFIMIWNTGNGWKYIDCRNDPVLADPNIYAGMIGYVCEFEN